MKRQVWKPQTLTADEISTTTNLVGILVRHLHSHLHSHLPSFFIQDGVVVSHYFHRELSSLSSESQFSLTPRKKFHQRMVDRQLLTRPNVRGFPLPAAHHSPVDSRLEELIRIYGAAAVGSGIAQLVRVYHDRGRDVPKDALKFLPRDVLERWLQTYHNRTTLMRGPEVCREAAVVSSASNKMHNQDFEQATTKTAAATREAIRNAKTAASAEFYRAKGEAAVRAAAEAAKAKAEADAEEYRIRVALKMAKEKAMAEHRRTKGAESAAAAAGDGRNAKSMAAPADVSLEQREACSVLPEDIHQAETSESTAGAVPPLSLAPPPYGSLYCRCFGGAKGPSGHNRA